MCQHGSAADIALLLGVGRDTARRWLIAAGANLGGGGRPAIEVDTTALRERRADGATLAELADEFGIAPETVRRRLRSG